MNVWSENRLSHLVMFLPVFLALTARSDTLIPLYIFQVCQILWFLWLETNPQNGWLKWSKMTLTCCRNLEVSRPLSWWKKYKACRTWPTNLALTKLGKWPGGSFWTFLRGRKSVDSCNGLNILHTPTALGVHLEHYNLYATAKYSCIIRNCKNACMSNFKLPHPIDFSSHQNIQILL